MQSWPKSISQGAYQAVTSLVSECIGQVDTFRTWKNSHAGSLTCRIRANILGEARWKTGPPGNK